MNDTSTLLTDSNKMEQLKINHQHHVNNDTNPTKGKYLGLALVGIIGLTVIMAISIPLLTTGASITISPQYTSINHPNKDFRRDVSSNEFPYNHIRLPKHIYPIHYHLYLDHDLDNFNIHGKVQIVVRCSKKTNFLVFHHNNSVILSISIAATPDSSGTLSIVRSLFNPKTFLHYLQFNQDLLTNISYTLTIQFRSKIYLKGINGLYRSTYTDGQHKER